MSVCVYRLFYLSRSDGERLVLPLLQILNTLPRVLQSPAVVPPSSSTGAVPAKAAEATHHRRSIPSPSSSSSSSLSPSVSGVAPPIAAICGVCLLTLSKDKSFCSELFKKVRYTEWSSLSFFLFSSLPSLCIPSPDIVGLV